MPSTLSERVVRRFIAFKYEPKENKKSKVDRLMRYIRDETGVSRGVATDIANAIVRNREVDRLAIQKGWPVERGVITGPQGTLAVDKVRTKL